ncbi:VanZ like protein [Glaciihabitans tibetensis]|uniref:VanZ like protein n=1 Tax=Glaciihabitans tibetensis TaxID=1266600 RepID=A0A2T0V2A4_9MICO|nr:VanZ family protein [Glaciihabitans tibetensis]PRY64315.1 VanZ like protein [Glaciihabitans tibetensis]
MTPSHPADHSARHSTDHLADHSTRHTATRAVTRATTGPTRYLHRISRVVLVGYLAVAALIVFWPTPVDRPVHGQVAAAVTSAQQAGATAVTYNTVEIAANVALFVPLGVLLVLVFVRMPWWLAIAICAALSALVELGQRVFIAERFASPIDIAANTAGGALGVVAAVLMRRWHR